MKYLKYFQTEVEHSTYKDSSEYILPNVSYIEDEETVYYNPLIINNSTAFSIDVSILPSEFINRNFYVDLHSQLQNLTLDGKQVKEIYLAYDDEGWFVADLPYVILSTGEQVSFSREDSFYKWLKSVIYDTYTGLLCVKINNEDNTHWLMFGNTSNFDNPGNICGAAPTYCYIYNNGMFTQGWD